MMRRHILQNLVRWKEKKNRKPLILKGVRQTGKTYILREFGERHFNKTIYLNFENEADLRSLFDKNLNPKRIIEELEFYFDTKIEIERDLVIFDEIQACPLALTSLKYFAEELPQLSLCAAGSLLGLHLGEGSFPVGKVDMMAMYPLSFLEFLDALGDEKSLTFLSKLDVSKEIPALVHQHLFERLKWYFVVGGLPEVVALFCSLKGSLFEAFKEVRIKQNELRLAYFADIAKHSGKVNAMHIERVWHAIPAQMSKTEDGSAKKFSFKGVIPGVDRYSRLVGAIDWLEAAGLAIKVKIVNTGNLPFSAYAEESTFKLLLFDVGMLGAMSGLPPKSILDEDYGSYKGYFAENFIAQEFLCQNIPLFCWMEKRSEVEFLWEREGKVIPVEVKSGWVTKTQSLFKFMEKYSSQEAIIFSARNLSLEGGVHRLPLYCSGLITPFLNC